MALMDSSITTSPAQNVIITIKSPIAWRVTMRKVLQTRAFVRAHFRETTICNSNSSNCCKTKSRAWFKSVLIRAIPSRGRAQRQECMQDYWPPSTVNRTTLPMANISMAHSWVCLVNARSISTLHNRSSSIIMCTAQMLSILAFPIRKLPHPPTNLPTAICPVNSKISMIWSSTVKRSDNVSSSSKRRPRIIIIIPA